MSKKEEQSINSVGTDESKDLAQLGGLLLHDDTNVEEAEDKADEAKEKKEEKKSDKARKDKADKDKADKDKDGGSDG